MPIVTEPAFWALAILAFLISGISKAGFASGAGNLAVPLMSLVIPAPQAAGIALPVLCAIDAAGLKALWRLWSVRELKAILPGGLAGVVVGALVFGLMSDAMVKLMVGAISLVFVGRALWQARPGRIAPPPATPSRVRGGFWGMIAGFTSTIAHAGGPPLAVYLFPLRLDRRVLSATTAVFFGALNYVKLVPYFFLGQLDATNLLTALLLIPVAPVGVYIGIWLAARITDAWFYRVVYAMLGATGLKLVWDGLGL